MPSNNRVGFDEDQGAAPVAPRTGQDDPEDSIARANLRAVANALQCCELLTESKVLERDGVVPAAVIRKNPIRAEKRVVLELPTWMGEVRLEQVFTPRHGVPS
jgi:hypothetical protein